MTIKLQQSRGIQLFRGYLDRAWQEMLAGEIRRAVELATPFTPTMPRSGRPFSVRMTNLGPLGWVSDKAGGYRYQATHPLTGEAWPPMPSAVVEIWERLADYPLPPEACLINLYAPSAKMGLHRDADEMDFAAPVVSISLGDDSLFRIGGLDRGDPTRSVRLASGDVVVLGGTDRLAYHGVDRIYPRTCDLLADWLPDGGRVNLTLRRVTLPG